MVESKGGLHCIAGAPCRIQPVPDDYDLQALQLWRDQADLQQQRRLDIRDLAVKLAQHDIATGATSEDCEACADERGNRVLALLDTHATEPLRLLHALREEHPRLATLLAADLIVEERNRHS